MSWFGTFGRTTVFTSVVLLAAVQCDAGELRGRIVGVTDGDTVTLLTADRVQERVRLAGIDAPEKRQAFGNPAKRKLSGLAYRQEAVILWSKRDRYGRIVGTVMVNGQDVGLVMVQSGLAWHYKRYEREQPLAAREAYARAENAARAARSGLWSDQHAEPPWEFRAERRH